MSSRRAKRGRSTDQNKRGCNLQEEQTQIHFANDTLQSNTSAEIARLDGQMKVLEKRLSVMYTLMDGEMVAEKVEADVEKIKERLDELEADFELIKDEIYTSQPQTPSKKRKLTKASSKSPRGTRSTSQFAKHNKGGKRAINATTGSKDGNQALKELMEKGNFPTVKAALLAWCQKVVDPEIKTFGSKYWKDGSALCTLFYSCCSLKSLEDHWMKIPQYDDIINRDDTEKFKMAKRIADKLNIRLNVSLPKIIETGRCEIKDFLPVVRAIYIGMSESKYCNVY